MAIVVDPGFEVDGWKKLSHGTSAMFEPTRNETMVTILAAPSNLRAIQLQVLALLRRASYRLSSTLAQTFRAP